MKKSDMIASASANIRMLLDDAGLDDRSTASLAIDAFLTGLAQGAKKDALGDLQWDLQTAAWRVRRLAGELHSDGVIRVQGTRAGGSTVTAFVGKPTETLLRLPRDRNIDSRVRLVHLVRRENRAGIGA
jgi:hypothetical protein